MRVPAAKPAICWMSWFMSVLPLATHCCRKHIRSRICALDMLERNNIKSFICKAFRFSILKCSNKVWQLILTPGKELISIPIIQFIWPCDQMIIPPVFKRSSSNKIKRALTECIKLLLGHPGQPSSDSAGRSRHVLVVLAAQLVSRHLCR